MALTLTNNSMATLSSNDACTCSYNLEAFSLIWLDSNANNDEQNHDAQQKLRSIINTIKTFDDSKECQQYIEKMSKDDRLILIVSDQWAREFVPRIHEFRHVSFIALYFTKKSIEKEWIKEFKKVRIVTNRLDELISGIQSTQKCRLKIETPLPMNIFRTDSVIDQSTTELNGQFIHAQLLIDCFLRMATGEKEKQQFISLCESQYKDSRSQIAIIEQFKNTYSPDRALWWYTCESFLYKMLNKALRVQNIDVLFLFHWFIRDLHQQLESCRCHYRVRVYRGQLISSDELHNLKQSIGQLISINSFFSTTVDRELALFILGDTAQIYDLEPLLFEIDADPSAMTTKPFADISPYSQFHESEVLFMIGSIFRVADVHRSEGRQWIIQMTYCNDDDHDLKQLFEHMRKENGMGDTHMGSFGALLQKMGKLNSAEKYYRHLWNELPSDHPFLVTLYLNLGIVLYDKGEYDNSLQLFQKSLEITKRHMSSDYQSIGETYNWIGEAFRQKNDIPRAVEFYNMGIAIFREANDEQNLKAAPLFGNMGTVLQQQMKLSDSLTFREKALAIQQKHLPMYHPDLGIS
ncbi:unnamed protein product [Rotaria socialis]|uniref:Tetratricopeptide repeat protein n=2 Tax=Rotaria TaxID=231623 RepID=A0A816QHH6_9BILA|nr:unnamed protein product [Rotaria magnacalcarata]CAF3031045.1 unnamed protein product [Rotaria socialis]CAF1673100.1 unnamed protein product [Rotaria magnacalcarata]CAF2046395.1 unnamed protein product [Rotaria magnacalcarata]CAF2061223.1 unnamed protein product [Rotaria magnacalcarata]